MQPVGRLSGRLRGTSEESHTGSEPLWSGWRQKDSIAVALLPEHRTWKRGMSVHFPLRVLHFMYSKEDGLLPPSVMYSVRCWVCCAQLMEEQKGEVSTRTTHYAVGQPTGVCVFPSPPLPPRDAGKYCWRRKMGSRYLFSWLSFLFPSHVLSIPSW